MLWRWEIYYGIGAIYTLPAAILGLMLSLTQKPRHKPSIALNAAPLVLIALRVMLGELNALPRPAIPPATQPALEQTAVA